MTWTVTFGCCTFRYYTEYHAAQFCRALALNGTPYTLTVK
jgi:hypothetical protein